MCRLPSIRSNCQVISSKFPGRAASILTFLPLMLTAQRAQENIPLTNWSTPLHWHASRAEREAAAKPESPLPQTTNTVAPDSLTFVAITPCRLVDTRGAAAGFNGDVSPFAGPSLGPGTTTPIPVQSPTEATDNTMPAPCGTIPATAEAYSFNITVIPQSGTVNYVTLWTTGSAQPGVATLNDTEGSIVSNAAIISAGTSGSVNLYNSGPSSINVAIVMNGYF